jgi:hypothetical protein
MTKSSFPRRWVVVLLGAALLLAGSSRAARAAFPDLEPFVGGGVGFVKPKGWAVRIEAGRLYSFAPGPHPPGIVLAEGPLKAANVAQAVDLQLGSMANVAVVRRWNPNWEQAGAVCDADVAGGRHRVAVLVKISDDGAVVGTLMTKGAGEFERLGQEALLRTIMISLHAATDFPEDALRGAWESTASSGHTLSELQSGAALAAISGGRYSRFDFLPGQKYRRIDIVRTVGLAISATLVTEATGTFRLAGDTLTLQEARCSYRHYDRDNAYKGKHPCSSQPRYLVVALDPEAGGIKLRGLDLRANDPGSSEVALKRPH